MLLILHYSLSFQAVNSSELIIFCTIGRNVSYFAASVVKMM
jgi:hypothetical protein